MSERLLHLKGVFKDYGTDVVTTVLKGIDLDLGAGEFAALIGPSGSGKSTLLNIIGLLERPTRGIVSLGGTETTTLDEVALTKLRARMLGFVFQFHHLLPAFTALENVMLPTWGDEGSRSDASEARAKELLRAVGLTERMNFKATKLSGGQQQRVAIARALSRQPPLILADEPTGNLDTESSKEVFALMRRFNRDFGTAFLIVTHDPRIAEQCDRVIELVDGEIVPRGEAAASPRL